MIHYQFIFPATFLKVKSFRKYLYIFTDQTSDDEDNITVTVPPAHMQVRGANFRRHRMRDHVENYNQSADSNTPIFEEKEVHGDDKYRQQKKPVHSQPSQIPSVGVSYRNNDETGNGNSSGHNFPSNTNAQTISTTQEQPQEMYLQQNPNPNMYHQQPTQHLQMHGPSSHYPPQQQQQPYGPQPHYGVPMG